MRRNRTRCGDASPPLAHHGSARRHATRLRHPLGLGLAWPWVASPLIGVTVWLPLVILGAVTCVGESLSTVLDGWRRSLEHGSFCRRQLWPTAAARTGRPISRYMDLLSWSVLVNAMAGLAMIQRASAQRAFRPGLELIFAAWIGFQMLGIVRVTRACHVLAAARQGWFHAHVQNVRQFIVTDDVEWFRTPCTGFVALSGPGNPGKRMASAPVYTPCSAE